MDANLITRQWRVFFKVKLVLILALISLIRVN